jgi:hypothetical protein
MVDFCRPRDPTRREAKDEYPIMKAGRTRRRASLQKSRAKGSPEEKDEYPISNTEYPIMKWKKLQAV